MSSSARTCTRVISEAISAGSPSRETSSLLGRRARSGDATVYPLDKRHRVAEYAKIVAQNPAVLIAAVALPSGNGDALRRRLPPGVRLKFVKNALLRRALELTEEGQIEKPQDASALPLGMAREAAGCLHGSMALVALPSAEPGTVASALRVIAKWPRAEARAALLERRHLVLAKDGALSRYASLPSAGCSGHLAATLLAPIHNLASSLVAAPRQLHWILEQRARELAKQEHS